MNSYAYLRSLARQYPWQPIADDARTNGEHVSNNQRSQRIGSERTAYGGELAYVLGLRCTKDTMTKNQKSQFDPDGRFDLCEGCYCLLEAGHLTPKVKGTVHVCPVCSVLMNGKSCAGTVNDEESPTAGYFCDNKDPTWMFDSSSLEWRIFHTTEEHHLPPFERMWVQEPELKFRRVHHWLHHHFKTLETGKFSIAEAQLCFRCDRPFQTADIKSDAFCKECRAKVHSMTMRGDEQNSVTDDDDTDEQGSTATSQDVTTGSPIRSSSSATETTSILNRRETRTGEALSPSSSASTEVETATPSGYARQSKRTKTDDESTSLVRSPKVSRRYSTQDPTTSRRTSTTARISEEGKAVDGSSIRSISRQNTESKEQEPLLDDSAIRSAPRRIVSQEHGQVINTDADSGRGMIIYASRMVEKMGRCMAQVHASDTLRDMGISIIRSLRKMQPPAYQYVDITLYYMCVHLFSDGTSSAWTSLLYAGELENWLKRDTSSTNVITIALVSASVFARVKKSGIIENTIQVCCSQVQSVIDDQSLVETILQNNLGLLTVLCSRYRELHIDD